MSFSLKRDEDSRCALAPIPVPRVQIGASAHRTARNPAAVCKSALLHTARPETPALVCKSALLHTARPETQPRCANRRFCTPRDPKPSRRVQIGASAHRNGSVSLPSANQSIAELLYECEIVEILIDVLEICLILV